MNIKIMFDFECFSLVVDSHMVVWPGGCFISENDGCWHMMVTDYRIKGNNDTYELVAIPRDEYRCFAE